MATTLITRIVSSELANATAKNDTLTSEELDNNFISLSRNKLEIDKHLSELTNLDLARKNIGLGDISTKDIPLAVSFGGTGNINFPIGSLLVGAGTSRFDTIKPGKPGQIIMSNGEEWIVSNPPGSNGTVYLVRGGPGLSGNIVDSGELRLGTPSTCTVNSANSVTEFSHTHAIDFPLLEITAGVGLISSGTKSKTVSLGTPSTLSDKTRNFVTENSHTHQVNFPVLTVNGKQGNVIIDVPNLDEYLKDVTVGDGLDICGSQELKTISLSQPSTLTLFTPNKTTANSHTHRVEFPVTSVNGKTGDVEIKLDDFQNIPDASTISSGLVNTINQTFGGIKSFVSSAAFNPQNSNSSTVFIGSHPINIPNVNLYVKSQSGQPAILVDSSNNVNSTPLIVNKAISGDYIKFQYADNFQNQHYIGSIGTEDGNSVYHKGKVDFYNNVTFNKNKEVGSTFVVGASASPSPHFQMYVKPHTSHSGIVIDATDHVSNIGLTINKLNSGDYIRFQHSANSLSSTFIGQFGVEKNDTVFYKGNIHFKDGIFEFNKPGNINYSFNIGQYDTIFDNKMYSAYIGNVVNGGSSLIVNAKNLNVSSYSQTSGIEIALNQTNPHYISFLFGSSNFPVGSISTNGISVHYGTNSDYRLKTDVSKLSNAQDILMKLRPITFTWKNTSISTFGFLAHEVAKIIPDAVIGNKDATDNGTIIPQSLDQSKIVPILTAALQEAFNRIEMLENRIAMAEKHKK
jgi:hypothetical protein